HRAVARAALGRVALRAREAAVPKDRERGAVGRAVARLRLLCRRRQRLVRRTGFPLLLGRREDRREWRRSVRRAGVRAGYFDDPTLGGEGAQPLRAAAVLPAVDGYGPRAVRLASTSRGGDPLGLPRGHGDGARHQLDL